MASELDDLYQDMILDHYKHPRNCHAMADATHRAEGHNPLCGDRVKVFLKLEDGIIADVSFEGSGCAISKASASLMTAQLKGKTVAEAEALFAKVHQMLMGTADPQVREELGKLAALSGVCEFPVRVKCATLAWHTLHNAIAAPDQVVKTE